jgi:acetoin utilization deacetylase AcuC-like enzyme
MTLLYYDDAFLRHETGSHPENAGRLRTTISHLSTTGLLKRCTLPTWEAVDHATLLTVHDEAYLDSLKEFANRGGGRIEADTLVSPESFEVARLAAGAACDAVRRVVAGEDQHALVLCRPPGHHALPDRPMGFCLFSNVSLAARVTLDQLGLDRVLIVDWDVHHGNGTQDIFWTEERVGFLSIHRSPFYPGTGAAGETGTGAALGTTLNLPVTFGTSRQDYLTRFEMELERFANRIRPQLVLVSAGFDAHREHPVGSLGLESEDFVRMTAAVQHVANAHCQGKIVSVLEGGYTPQRLAESIGLHLATLLETEKRDDHGA